MFVDYLSWFPALRIVGAMRWLISITMLAVVTALNLVGVDVVAQVYTHIAIYLSIFLSFIYTYIYCVYTCIYTSLAR